jgi:hypothetical protein
LGFYTVTEPFDTGFSATAVAFPKMLSPLPSVVVLFIGVVTVLIAMTMMAGDDVPGGLVVTAIGAGLLWLGRQMQPPR